MAVSERKTTVYIPDKLVDLNILGNLALIAEKSNRSLNAIICRILADYVRIYCRESKPKKLTKVKAPKKSVERTHTPKLPKPPKTRVSSTSSQGKV